MATVVVTPRVTHQYEWVLLEFDDLGYNADLRCRICGHVAGRQGIDWIGQAPTVDRWFSELEKASAQADHEAECRPEER